KLAALVLMPEASMDEYRYFPAGHDDVRCSRKISPMQAIAKTGSSERLTDEQLGLRALATDPCHHLVASFFGDNVGHGFCLPGEYLRSAQVCLRSLESSVQSGPPPSTPISSPTQRSSCRQRCGARRH